MIFAVFKMRNQNVNVGNSSGPYGRLIPREAGSLLCGLEAFRVEGVSDHRHHAHAGSLSVQLSN